MVKRAGPPHITKYSVLSTRYSVLSIQYSVLSTQYSVLGTRYWVLSASPLTTRHKTTKPKQLQQAVAGIAPEQQLRRHDEPERFRKPEEIMNHGMEAEQKTDGHGDQQRGQQGAEGGRSAVLRFQHPETLDHAGENHHGEERNVPGGR